MRFLSSLVFVRIVASFAGLGGWWSSHDATSRCVWLYHAKTVGTSFLTILIIFVSALAAYSKLSNVNFRVAFALGIGGMLGAQIGHICWSIDQL